ncbi:MAG: ABC transporter permease, partial [Myxococcales bacterium]|nr:ABC transporter permease [Myxococcales bacterium]
GALFALVLAWRRRRTARGPVPPPGAFERDVRLAVLALATAPAWAWLAAGEPGADVASAATALAALFLTLVVFGLLPLAAAGLVALRHGPEWFIAVRYLVARRRQVFISAITAICVTGIAAGVWLIITVLSVMNGFERTWREEIIGNRAHFTVHSGFGPFGDYEGVLRVVAGVPGVTAVSPYLDAEGMVRTQHGEIFAVRLRGVDPVRVGAVTDLRDDLRVGSLEQLAAFDAEAARGEGDAGILVGSQLAAATGVSLGDSILLISPYGGAPTPLGPAPRLARFRVAGIFQSSFFQYDEVYTYTSLAAAQDFRRSGDVVDGLEARTTDFYRSRQVAAEVVRELEYPFYTRDWKEYFPAFFQALKTERVMMFVLLSMVMVVAAFSIVATLIMMIMEKSSDIAILKTMGAEDESIERIFALEGTLIGLGGTLLGVLAGLAVTTRLDWVQRQIEALTGIDTLPAEIYQLSTLPSEVNPVDVLVIASIAMVLSLGATLLPSRQGARVDPVEGLRHE